MTYFVWRRPHGAVGVEPEEYDSFHNTTKEAAEGLVHALRLVDRENWYWLSQTAPRRNR